MVKYFLYGDCFYAVNLRDFRSMAFNGEHWRESDVTVTEILHDTDRNAGKELSRAEIQQICKNLPKWDK